MVCEKFHMNCYVTFLCLQKVANTSNIATGKVITRAWHSGNSVNILQLSQVLYLQIVFIPADVLNPGSDLLVCLQLAVSCCWVLLLSLYCLSDSQQWLCTKVEGAGGLPLSQFTGKKGEGFRHNTYMYILQLSEVLRHYAFIVRVYLSQPLLLVNG